MAERPSIVYVSYDGVAEPIGQSQILAYLRRLAPAADIALISFEKPADDLADVRRDLQAAGIRWRPLRYHRRPPLLSTAWDLARGSVVLARHVRRLDADVVHARSYVPAAMVMLAGAHRRARFLFDIRGFWGDERADAGQWPRGSLMYRLVKACERRFFRHADAIVTLTDASIPHLRRWLGDRDVPIEVIPTCADVDAFARTARPERGPRAVWAGSIGPWYRFDLAAPLARACGRPLTVLSRQLTEVRKILDGEPADVRTVSPRDMTGELRPGDLGLCLIRPSFSKLASAPTRFAEYLAAGMPVAVLAGVGDLDRIVTGHRIGVVLADDSRASLEAAARELVALAADPGTAARCRAVAESHFDVATGAARYAALWQALVNRGRPGAAAGREHASDS